MAQKTFLTAQFIVGVVMVRGTIGLYGVIHVSSPWRGSLLHNPANTVHIIIVTQIGAVAVTSRVTLYTPRLSASG